MPPEVKPLKWVEVPYMWNMYVNAQPTTLGMLPDRNCWEVTSHSVTEHGYAQVYGPSHDGFHSAHRWIYYKTYGEFDLNLCVLHRCDNPLCVNPSHLFLGTNADNAHDRDTKGRRSEHLPTGGLQRILTEQQAHQICVLRAAGSSYEKLGELFGVAPTTVRQITYGETYKDVVGRVTTPRVTCKFSDTVIREIKQRSLNGELGKALAVEFGVRPPMISRILSGKRYDHVV